MENGRIRYSFVGLLLGHVGIELGSNKLLDTACTVNVVRHTKVVNNL